MRKAAIAPFSWFFYRSVAYVAPKETNWRNPQFSVGAKQVKMGKANGARQTEQGRRAEAEGPKLACLLLLGSLFCVLMMLAGCNSLNSTASTPGLSDPLVGGPPLQPSTPVASRPTTPVTTLPALPAPNLGTSNATLAAGVSRPFDNSRDLRIDHPRGNSGNDGWAGQGGAPRGDGSGAMLRGLEPADGSALPRDPPATYNPVSIQNSEMTILDQALKQLRARGVVFVQSGENEEWEVRCSVPNRQNPKLRRTHVAHDRDLLAAIRAVIEKIDREQQGPL
jgi:hypothetical protein